VGSEIRKTRPAVVVQNDHSNRTAATTIVAPVTSRARSRLYPNEAFVRAGEGGCRLDSIVLARQIRGVDHARLVRRLGKLHTPPMCLLKARLVGTLPDGPRPACR